MLLNCAAWTVVLPGVMTLLWFLLPLEIRLLFRVFEVAEIALIFSFMLAIAWSVGLSYVKADASGLVFRNGLRTHRVSWDEVESVKLTRHDPWAYLYVTRDIGRLMMLGIMRVDGERAKAAAETLRQMHREYKKA